jgi:hypothetical protein
MIFCYDQGKSLSYDFSTLKKLKILKEFQQKAGNRKNEQHILKSKLASLARN